MKLSSLQELFVNELRDLYSAEQQILQALPKMSRKASSTDLKSAFDEHYAQTRTQVERLDRIGKQLNLSLDGKPCKAMQGIIAEGDELLKADADPAVLDAALIGAAQRVEHYEIASYGTTRTFAQQLGLREAADLLQQTLDEEGMTDKKLSALAERGLNQRAERSAGA